MEITLQRIIPFPLKEKIAQRNSEIWNTNLEFTKKEFIKIVAPSGTGKTTLIHTLYGIRQDYQGEIKYNNKNIKEINAEEMATFRQKNISVIFQDLRLFEHLTVLENILLKSSISAAFTNEKRIHEMVETLGITPILQQKAKICSYGEQQRVATIRALIQPFDWLLMDEPFSHLDNSNTQKAAKLIEEECTKRKAGFILTDLDEDNNFTYQKQLKL